MNLACIAQLTTFLNFNLLNKKKSSLSKMDQIVGAQARRASVIVPAFIELSSEGTDNQPIS